jgi:hypothetical protein
MEGERYYNDDNYTALRGQGDAELYRDDGHHAHPASKLLSLLWYYCYNCQSCTTYIDYIGV